MMYPKENALVHWIFSSYVKWLVGKTFNKFNYNNIDVDAGKSVLLVANHFSFWDGLILFLINKRLWKKKFHVMILKETAVHSSILRYAGAFSVSKNSREMLQSLNYAAGLLQNPDNLVLMFPQGKLYSNFVDHVNFNKGIMRLIEKAEGKFRLVFAATFIQYLKHKKPSVTVYFKNEPGNYAGRSIKELQDNYQQHYQAAKQLETEIEI